MQQQSKTLLLLLLLLPTQWIHMVTELAVFLSNKPQLHHFSPSCHSMLQWPGDIITLSTHSLLLGSNLDCSGPPLSACSCMSKCSSYPEKCFFFWAEQLVHPLAGCFTAGCFLITNCKPAHIYLTCTGLWFLDCRLGHFTVNITL